MSSPQMDHAVASTNGVDGGSEIDNKVGQYGAEERGSLLDHSIDSTDEDDDLELLKRLRAITDTNAEDDLNRRKRAHQRRHTEAALFKTQVCHLRLNCPKLSAFRSLPLHTPSLCRLNNYVPFFVYHDISILSHIFFMQHIERSSFSSGCTF